MKKIIAFICLSAFILTPWNPINTVAADKTAPIFKSSVPAKNMYDIQRNAKISVTFSENIYKSKTFTQIKLKNISTGKYVSITRSIVGKILRINHSYFFAYNNSYALTIPSKTLKDKSGNLLKNAVTIKFRTIAKTPDAAKTECLSNLRHINGAYRIAIMDEVAITGLNDLTPTYLSAIPVCPSNGQYTLKSETEKSLAHFECGDASHQPLMFWPLSGNYNISSPFGLRYHPITGVYKMHTGMDIPAASGTPIIAAAAGTVKAAEWNSAYGNQTIIDHGNGTCTFYGHQDSISVTVGQVVKAGEMIGTVGSTGYSTGPHLHFGVIADAIDVDPMPYL